MLRNLRSRRRNFNKDALCTLHFFYLIEWFHNSPTNKVMRVMDSFYSKRWIWSMVQIFSQNSRLFMTWIIQNESPIDANCTLFNICTSRFTVFLYSLLATVIYLCSCQFTTPFFSMVLEFQHIDDLLVASLYMDRNLRMLEFRLLRSFSFERCKQNLLSSTFDCLHYFYSRYSR